jgi:hypothetical protein
MDNIVNAAQYCINNKMEFSHIKELEDYKNAEKLMSLLPKEYWIHLKVDIFYDDLLEREELMKKSNEEILKKSFPRVTFK